MSRATVALTVAVVALLASALANVVAFTRPDPDVPAGSITPVQLAPDARAQLEGERGAPGKRGPTGPRGLKGPRGFPGLPGRNGTDVSNRVDALEGFEYRLCDTWILTREEGTGEQIWQKFGCG